MTCVFFQYSLSPSISHFKKKLYCRLLLYYFRCVKKKSVKTLPSSTTVYYSTAIDVISVYFPPPRQLDSVLTMKKKSKILLVRNWRKIHQYHHTWLQTSVMFPNYVMIKTGVYYGVSIFGMARYRKRNLK